jgi:hypothetical protein
VVSDVLRLMGICPGDTVVLEAEVQALRAYRSRGLGYAPRRWRVLSIQDGLAEVESLDWPDNTSVMMPGRELCLETEIA